MDDKAALSALFAKLGAPNPENWANSQIQEDIPQLHRFLFLRQAWKNIVHNGDTAWMSRALTTPPHGPGGAIAPALRRLLDLGCDAGDLTTVVRTLQWQLLFRLCYLLDDPDLEGEDKSVDDLAWGLFEVDADGRPGRAVNGLHESVLETDPEGKEMCG
ncbi:hypothetical protein [Asticcacaulis solisilvae]|uniref:hypothetical protein n=1 Tax=Asticcacaulis solisilvae TaxID=1217274 RepID=UPI003FD7BBE1